MTTFGDLAPAGAILEPGLYDGIIERCDILRNDDGSLKKSDDGKSIIDVFVRLDRDTSLKRRLYVSFGKNNSNGKWSGFSEFISAVMGVPCGDPRQRSFEPTDVINKEVRVMAITSPDGQYTNIEKFMPATKTASKKPKPVEPSGFDDTDFPLERR